MDFRIDVQPSDDMTPAEVAALTASLRDAIDRLPDVDDVKQVQGAAPAGSKGVLTMVGSLLVSSPVVSGVFDVIKAVASRPGSPPVTIKVTRDGVEGSFDPKTVTPEQFAALAALLKQDIKPA